MPKLKPSPIKAQADIVHRNIVSRGAYFGCFTDKEFGARLGIAASTFCTRRANPSGWHLDELIKVTIAFKCTLKWLMEDHSAELKEVSQP